MKNKTVLITGIYGHIGLALTKKLMEKGYDVCGIDRYESNKVYEYYFEKKIARVPKVFISEMREKDGLLYILNQTHPQYIVHLAGCVHVGDSFIEPLGTLENNIGSTVALLEAVKGFDSNIALVNAASAEVYGNQPSPQNENTTFSPRSFYAISKVTNVYLIRMYRSFGLKRLSNAYIFNTESEERSSKYILRKITVAAARIKHGLQDEVVVGNLNTKRTWISRDDTVNALIAIMLLPNGDEFVISADKSGTRSVRELTEYVFQVQGIPITWEIQPPSSSQDKRSENLREVGMTAKGKVVVRVDENLFRPLDVMDLQGDASKLSKATGWKPAVTFDEMVKRMLEYDNSLAIKEITLQKNR